MATDYTKRATITRDETYQLRVRTAANQVAQEVVAEVKGSFTDAQWKQRGDLAQSVLQMGDGSGLLTRFVWFCATKASVADPETSTDGELFSAITAGWSALAGFNTSDVVP